MLISGRWLVLLLFLTVGNRAFAAPLPPVADLNRDAAIAAEQQRAFGLSSASRLLPNDHWFIENDGGRNPGLKDPMERRWARDPYAFPQGRQTTKGPLRKR